VVEFEVVGAVLLDPVVPGAEELEEPDEPEELEEPDEPEEFEEPGPEGGEPGVEP
jgi:hypothetical protein